MFGVVVGCDDFLAARADDGLVWQILFYGNHPLFNSV
jgi:hypothetical protein